MGPASLLRERFITWALRVRPPEPTPIVLGQRRIYVLPTRAGLAYAMCLLVMLLGAINYTLSLGYALTFLLVGLGVVAILHAFANLLGLNITLGRIEPTFAKATAVFQLILHNNRDEERSVIRLSLPGQPPVAVDVPPRDGIIARLPLPAPRRGWLTMPRVTIETTHPLGLIRAWSYCAPDLRCLVYPEPAASAPPLPYDDGDAGGRIASSRGSDDFSGLRGYQAADPPRHVAWKIAARRGAESPLLTKQFAGSSAAAIWLDWNHLPAGIDGEERLSILTRWVLDAERQNLAWGLRLPEKVLPVARGSHHLHACLRALALHGQTD